MFESTFKKTSFNKFKGIFFILILMLSESFTCYKQNQPEKEYLGSWYNASAKIQVRTKTGFMKYKFTSITIPISITISPQGTATCKIGNVESNSLSVTKNPGNVEKTGVIYIVKLGEIAQINKTDPLSKKEVELWIKPIKNEKTLQVEIRQMDLLDAFPMGEVVLEKGMSL
jgi:hypothetical protein